MFTIDFEASCLPRDGRSFPIEVGIADRSGWTRTWLIQPEPAWHDWTWTDEAEALHGLSRDHLYRDGRPCTEVMRELNAIVGGKQVMADHDLDKGWLATLAEAAGIAADFQIGHVAGLLDRYQPDIERIRHAVATANHIVPVRHRAGPDALWLAMFSEQLMRDEPPLFGWSRGNPMRSDLIAVTAHSGSSQG